MSSHNALEAATQDEASTPLMSHGSSVVTRGMRKKSVQHALQHEACKRGSEVPAEEEEATVQRAPSPAQLVHSPENKSPFRGLYWSKIGCKWHAQITVNKDTVYLGLFSDEAEAAAAFDKASLLMRGGEAKRLNFPLSNYLDEAGAIVEDQGIKKRLEKRG